MTILIPAYRPDERLLRLISALLGKHCRIVVADDGSGSPYKDVFNKARTLCAVVLAQEARTGTGASLKAGFFYSMDSGEAPDQILPFGNAGGRRGLVFGTASAHRTSRELPGYYMVYLILMLVNYLGLKVFYETLGMPVALIVAATEACMFLISYTLQSRLVFVRKRPGKG